jgi:hypothetical protein
MKNVKVERGKKKMIECKNEIKILWLLIKIE